MSNRLLLVARTLALGVGLLLPGLAGCATSGDTDAPPEDAGPSIDLREPPAEAVAGDAHLDVTPVDVPPADAGTTLAVSFTPEAAQGEAGRVAVRVARGEADDELVVELLAGSFPDVVGWAFDFTYPADALTFQDVAVEDVMSGQEWEGVCVARLLAPGRLNVGCARFARSPDFSGTASRGGPLVEERRFGVARFVLLRAGDIRLSFDPDRRAARGGDFGALQPSWVGGTVSAERVPVDPRGATR